MSRKRIAIACQGGGSQCAFVAGALNALFERRIQDRYDIVGLSGTSGGALTAALAWLGMLESARGDAPPVGERILAFWSDLSAQTPGEIAFDRMTIEAIRLGERGWFPTWAMSPSSPTFQVMSRAAALAIGRPEFTDLRAALVKHIDFARLPSLVGPDSPVLLVGAGDVIDGTFKVFSSAHREISADALLASAAIPNLFPAVWVEGHAYWDGIFSSNPPVFPLLRSKYMGAMRLPEEIWVIQINRTHNDNVPETPSDISDRRNELAGNLSLQHELQTIEMVNLLIAQGALTDEFRARFALDMTQPIGVRFIRISQSLIESLDYPSKLSRNPAHIDRLIADGALQAREFLARIGDLGGVGPPEPTVPVPIVESAGPGLLGPSA
jgi:NTE family protein